MYDHSQSKVPDGFTIKTVPIGLLSDSVFTPDLPLRPTQSTIGYFLEEKKSVADDSYGVHRSEYGGTGETRRALGKYENVVVRKAQSFRTALHGSPEPPMTGKIRAKRILDNKSFFAAPINEVGCDVFQLATQSKPIPQPAPKQLFPRSVVYEIEYVKEQYRKAMMDALEKERKEFEKIIQKQKKALEDEQTEDKQLSSIEQEVTAMPEKDAIIETKRGGHVHDVEQNKTKLSCVSICGLCGCNLTRGACPNCNTGKE
ncbi:uncharacterized protein [Halyomorpha halys]|nr:uncharacterized protein LOC106690525 isoform X2 [Halyomorpha halys]